jgi:hypothetical protein
LSHSDIKHTAAYSQLSACKVLIGWRVESSGTVWTEVRAPELKDMARVIERLPQYEIAPDDRSEADRKDK